MTDTVILDIQSGIASVELNRPDVLNALSPDMAWALKEVLTQITAETDVRCVVLSGHGPAFMAGGDLTYFKGILPQLSRGNTENLETVFDAIHAVVNMLHSMPQPVVAKVHGAVAGFGMSLMMACDLVMAAATSKFTLAYSAIGASPDGSSTYSLPRIVGTRRAMELALLADRFDAGRALELGLVNWVVPESELNHQCNELATRLSSGAAAAYAHTKKLINQSVNMDLDSQLAAEKRAFFDCAVSDDFAEGITAFLSKRKPDFKNSSHVPVSR